MTPSDFAWALGMCESTGNAWAPMSNNGRGVGRWQICPARLHTEILRSGLSPTLEDTWDNFVGRLVEAIYVRCTAVGYTPLAIAMYWHLDHFASVTDPDWDAEYAALFAKYQVRQAPPIET